MIAMLGGPLLLALPGSADGLGTTFVQYYYQLRVDQALVQMIADVQDAGKLPPQHALRYFPASVYPYPEPDSHSNR